MLNLLTENPSRAQIADAIRPGLAPFLPPMEDPWWDELQNQPALVHALNAIKSQALREAAAPLPELPDSLYEIFAQTGSRHEFEKPYFDRRRRLGRAAFALLAAEGQDRTLLETSFLNKLRQIVDETSWAVPAHVGKPSGRDPFCIDLFSAETAYAMAEYLTVFGTLIPGPLQEKIRARLSREYFQNYLNRCDEFVWTRITNNWNAVCHQGVVGAALLMEKDPEVLTDILFQTSQKLPNFLKGFSPDGGCSEGPGYWSYGFGWFYRLNEQLEKQTEGRLSLFEGDDLVRKIARFAPALSLSKGQCVNFADGGSGMACNKTLHYAGTRLNDPTCLRQARENFSIAFHPDQAVNLDGLRHDFTYWWRVFSQVPNLNGGRGETINPDSYLPQLGVWLVRGRDQKGHLWELAAKAGHNEEHHNHNDVGSILLNIDGAGMLTEIGAPLYVHAFFQKESRYRFLAARSLGHSLPVINGFEQENGREYSGTILRADIDQNLVAFHADITRAYPAAARCLKALRRLALNKEQGRLTWTDEVTCEGASALESAFVTHCTDLEIVSPELAKIRRDNLSLLLQAGEGACWDRLERHDYKNHSGQDAFIHRLVLKPLSSGPKTTLSVQISIAD